MRPRPILLVLCLLVLPALCRAQHAHQFEFGAFGSFTRYDRAFLLDNQIGGGGRLGYFFNPTVGFEFDVGYQQPSPTAGGGPATLSLGGASVVFNFGSSKNLFYVLGGYSRLSFTDLAAYTFDDNAVHGGLGDRIFLNERTALRLEGRALYSPNTNHTGGGWAGHVVASAGLAIFTGPSAFHDADGDGVADKKDTCPNTPAGATVDAKGCPSDSDKDGVYNGIDTCPNTIEGAEVDARGCPKDTDGDGVYDGIDKCPGTSTAGGVHVDATGCPIDSDHDGVPDGLDKCPNTPAGTEVDTVGCQRVIDSDGDGVDDRKDKCPGTAVGTHVDSAGCPILFPEAKTLLVLRGVTFEPGRSTLKPDSYTILDLVATSLVGNPDIRIEIAGHTDNTGSAATNTRLSQARADAVRTYLASKGVAPDRMVAKGYGPTQPVAPNTTADGRALNRRVELRKLN
ncbi:MAG TPA: OmpA family protein [Gemmatimonadales bacterium]|nr:OmpA family protein [Gemmatimonadales bacterium]